MTETAPRRFGFAFWSFIAFMTALTALFAGLGVWQVERLSWKEALIAQVTARSTAPPVVLPAATDWPTTDFGALAFAPVFCRPPSNEGRPPGGDRRACAPERASEPATSSDHRSRKVSMAGNVRSADFTVVRSG